MSDFVKGKNVPDKNVGDTISRQTAIDEMQEYWRALNLRRRRIPLAAEAVYMDLKGVVATLPSAEPKLDKNDMWLRIYSNEDSCECYFGNDL